MTKLATLILWATSTLTALFLVTQPVGNSVQMALSLSVIAVLAVIAVLRLDGIWRHVFLALGSVVVLRYAYWRTTSTLPPIDDLYSFIPGVVLYAAEMYCIVMLAISLFVVADPREREAAPRLSDEDAPSVDVFVPTYNEGKEILAMTLSAAKAMHYPSNKLRVFLLDDGGTDQKRFSDDAAVAEAAINRAIVLKDLCADLGVTYLTRAENVHAKAGNLNSGLSRTSGDLVVVFDADHAPERAFLQETVGYFSKDPNLFLVQTPHFFANADPIEHNLDTFTTMPSENEMFYGKIQKGLDRWNASFFCGSAAVLRREALEEVGGFSGITITEDCETALELHSRGWTSVYVDKPMIAGLQPETVSSFIGQRSRWCRGMVQILLLKNPLLKAGLSFAQRICYLSSSLFWFFPFVRAVFIFAPLLFILFNMKIFVASSEDFIAHTVTYLIVGELIRSYLYGSVRWPWMSEIYEYVQSVYLFRAIISVILQPRRPTFNVTAKGQSTAGDRLSELSLPYFAIFAVLAFTLGVSIYRYNTEPEISGLLMIVGAWNFLNLLIAGAGLGVITERRNVVEGIELPTNTKVSLTFGDKTWTGSALRASAAGATIQLPQAAMQALRKSDNGHLSIANPSQALIINSIPVTVAAHPSQEQQTLAIRFDLEAQHYPVVAEMILRDMSDVRSARTTRQKRRGMIMATVTLLRWAFNSPVSALALLLTGGSAASARRSQAPRLPANNNTAQAFPETSAKEGA
ncbi:UDP-forming cellulose synthase catalytic subunit [Rhizobium sp. Rhizsp42]|uniref:UDP-forming cellulose synthase catalytic subunit n=1 Tax=Rhizobium sp. Rhizsp42 TaxID=3243034 RepID=UPI0039B1170C